MRMTAGLLALGLLLVAAVAGADQKLPRAIDTPEVRPKVQEKHKGGHLQRHDRKFERWDWGLDKKRVTRPLEQRRQHTLHF